MSATLRQSASNDSLLLWTLICSMLLHLLLAVIVPNFKFDTPKPVKQELKIELIKPEPPPAAVVPEPPKPIEPEPIEPVVQEPIKPKVKPEPIKKVKQSPEPQPISEPVKETDQTPTPPPEVIAVAPTKTETQPTITVPPPPPPEPVKTNQPSEGDIDAARNAYRNQVQKELKRNQRYPKIAQSRGIEGEVKLKISVDSEGNVLDVQVEESSGNESLDNAAIDAVKRSNVKQYMQPILKGHIDNIIVKIGFKLA